MMVLSKANYSSEKQNLRMSSDVLSSIETAINAGKIVSTHTDEVTMGTWKGYGYIITDPSTGAAAYMISGGLSGGSSSDVVTLAYLVDIGFAIADIIEALRMIPTMLSFFSMGGPIGIAIGIVVAAVITATIIFAVMDFIESNRLMEAYLNGDEEAGKQLMTNMWINVGMAAGIKVIGVAGKAAVKTVAGKKVAKELGEEIAEKLLKNCDDPTAITKVLKNLDKANVPKDTIKDIAESAGQEGLEWFGKQAKNGIKGDVLEKVFKNASDYTKYTDDLLKRINSVDNYADNVIKCINNCGDDAIKVITDSSDELFERIAKSNGYADDIISCVKNYGDDAANAIVKHGDDAAIVISIYGKDAAEVVANASDELFERIMKSEGFAEDIISCVKKYGDDAANAIAKYGDDAVTVITQYGDVAVDVLSNYGDNGLKALTSLSKTGMSVDFIKTIAENFGEDGLNWFARHAEDGVGSEILEKIVKNADDYTKYTDEFVGIIGMYEGRINEIIEYINKHGDDGVADICELFKNGKYLGFTLDEVDNLKKVVINEGQMLKNMGLTNNQLGPAVAGAYDKSTGKIYTAINDYDGKIPSELSPIIKERIDNMPPDIYDSYAKYTKGAGSHAEVYAVNKLLLDNPNANLSDIAVYVNRTLGTSKPVIELPFETCPHCRYILESFNIISNK